MRLEPDKERFCDPDAMASDVLVHTVDFSDERSKRHFITVWTKRRMPEWSDRWPNHKREIYHREEPWLPAQFPGKEKEGWSKHYHIDLDRPPRLSDLDLIADDIPASILEQIANYGRQFNDARV